jgi:hypothetical protein
MAGPVTLSGPFPLDLVVETGQLVLSPFRGLDLDKLAFACQDRLPYRRGPSGRCRDGTCPLLMDLELPVMGLCGLPP